MARKKPDYTKFTPQQLQAAELMSDLEAKYTNVEVAEMVGISERQVYRWLNDEDFVALVNHRAEVSMDLYGVEIYRALIRKVRAGDVKAIELGMKRMGVLKEVRETTSNVSVEVTSVAGKTTDELLAEIAKKEALLLDTTETSPGEYEATDEWLDQIVDGRYERDQGGDAAE